MKNILLLVPDFSSPDRLEEALRVAAGLSQNPGLRVSLKLPRPPFAPPSPELREYLALFGEKGAGIHADSRWLELMPPSAQKIHQDSSSKINTSSFDLFIPF